MFRDWVEYRDWDEFRVRDWIELRVVGLGNVTPFICYPFSYFPYVVLPLYMDGDLICILMYVM